ncbi:RuBisCO large subunit-binding protein subunit alpha, chloroplastic [Hordeum vulgare]|nr:RuBisCO large subunit-binding protein subunit alpha, chloroplastic [Hordeum vulgare]
MAGDLIGGGGGGSAAGKGPRSSTRHQQFRDCAKTRVDDLQEIFFGLQSARKESRSADAVVLEEQVQRRLPRILPTAEDITGEALATLVVNKLRGIIHVGADIIQKALQAPASLIANNAGVEGEVVIEKIKDSEWEMGYNAMTDKCRICSQEIWQAMMSKRK